MAEIVAQNNVDVDMIDFVYRLPRDLHPCIKSFLKVELDYAYYEETYTWEKVEYMLNDVLPWGADFCCHLFKKFEKLGDNLELFYPNARTDTELTLLRKTWHDEQKVGVSFDKTDWFSVDYIKMHPGKSWYLSDDGTNYEALAKMITTVLRKFDEWYWRSYTATGVDHDMLTHIVNVYDTLEKYAHMDDDEFDDDDNSVEEASTGLYPVV